MAKTTKTTKEVTTVDKKIEQKSNLLGKPVVTEKAAKSSALNTYIFNVSFGATKSEISKAFQTQYKHKPVRVNIINKKPKSFFKKGILGFGKKGKKAYITLAKGTKIEVM